MTNRCEHELSIMAAKGAFCVLCRRQLTDAEYESIVHSDNTLVTFILAHNKDGWKRHD